MKKFIEIIRDSNIKPKNILEIGSRDGHDAELLRSEFNIQYEKVYIVEPNPSSYFNICQLYPKAKVFKKAIDDFNGIKQFNQVSEKDFDTGISSLLNRNFYNNMPNIKKIDVECITGKELIKDFNKIDICKIDVEGLTYQVLVSFEDSINKIKIMHIECEHQQVWDNQKLYKDCAEYLKSKKFIEIHFEYIANEKLQSDSIWMRK